jgi:hypothetical protein
MPKHGEQLPLVGQQNQTKALTILSGLFCFQPDQGEK